MDEEKFFNVSGLGVAAHTPETRKIWRSLPSDRPKSDYGKLAVLKFAKSEGFNGETEKAEDAFSYLLRIPLPNKGGKKSYILRHAIINFS